MGLHQHSSAIVGFYAKAESSYTGYNIVRTTSLCLLSFDKKGIKKSRRAIIITIITYKHYERSGGFMFWGLKSL